MGSQHVNMRIDESLVKAVDFAAGVKGWNRTQQMEDILRRWEAGQSEPKVALWESPDGHIFRVSYFAPVNAILESVEVVSPGHTNE